MAKKNYGHIVIIVVLILVFFTLLILSTSNKKVSVNYNFKDEIQINDNNLNQLNYLEIGNIVAKNNGIISSRVDLNKYVICQLSTYYGDQSYQVDYRGSDTVSGKAEMFDYDYYQKRLDISAGEELELVMTVNPYSIRNDIEQYSLYNGTLPFYLFKMGFDDNSYDFCINAKKEDALKTIYINLNINNTKDLGNGPIIGKY